MREIRITGNEAGQRLDKMLAKYLNEAPKSFLYKMLRKKNIVLNDKKATGNEKLEVSDVIKLYLAEDTIEKFKGKELEIIDTKEKLSIVYEDQDVIMINKPEGMLSQKAMASDISVVEHLVSYLVNTKQITREELKTFHPAICNRLDRNTSGLLVAGKSLRGLQVMSQLFHDRSLEKYYLCLVRGRVEQTQLISGYLVKNAKTNKVYISKEKLPDTTPIRTEYRPIKVSDQVSLLEVHLITGKTHQIRAHLSSIGHPIIGDYKYGHIKTNDYFRSKYGLQSQLLHSYRLQVPDISSQLPDISNKEFCVNPPELFQKIARDMGVF